MNKNNKASLTARLHTKIVQHELQAMKEDAADDYREDFYVEITKFFSYCIENAESASMTKLEKWLDLWWKK